MPPEIRRITEQFLHNPVRVEVAKPATTVANTTQLLVKTGREPHDKRDTLRHLIRTCGGFKNAIVFCNRKREVAQLHRSLVRHGFNAAALHGDMDQPARTAALDSFRKGDVTLLIASDVAARGLDIPAVSHVFNFDVPHHADDYVHRIGRTGRAGLTGTAITVVAPADQKSVAAIEKLIGQTIPWMNEQPRVATQERSGATAQERPVATARERDGAAAQERSEAGEHRNGGRRRHGRQSQRRREDVPAPVARLDDARPHREHKPAPHKPAPQAALADEGAGGHLPAFLLRPVRVKA
jgi:superfamily II DNA/RNA helicase